MVSSRKAPDGLKGWLHFVERKFMSLLVPYFLWGMIYGASHDWNFFRGLLWGTNLSLSSAGTNSVLWFLPTMFLASLLYEMTVYLERAIAKRERQWHARLVVLVEIGLSMAASARLRASLPADSKGMFFGADIAFSALALMLLGQHVVKPVMEKILTSGKVMTGFAMGVCLIVGFIGAQFNAPTEPYPVTIMALGLYGKSYLVFLIVAVVNSLGILCLCRLICNKPFAWLGRGSLVMMAGHYILFPYTIGWTQQLLVECSQHITYEMLYAVVNSGICTMLLIPFVGFVNRYAQVLNGKNIVHNREH